MLALEPSEVQFSARLTVPETRVDYTKFLTRAALLSTILLAGCSPSIHDVTAAGDIEGLSAMLDSDPELLKDENGLGQQAVHYAATKNRLDTLEVLHSHGADLSAQDHTGLTALHIAAQGDYRHVLRFLIKNGANFRLKDDFGDTPLHRAAMFGSSKAVNDLLKVGADARSENHEGKTPLDLARHFEHEMIVNRLALIVGNK